MFGLLTLCLSGLIWSIGKLAPKPFNILLEFLQCSLCFSWLFSSQIVCIDAEVKGIVSIQHRTVLGQTKMTVTYYAEQRSSRGTIAEVPKVKTKWFTPQKAKQLPNVGIVKLIKKVESGGEMSHVHVRCSVYSCEGHMIVRLKSYDLVLLMNIFCNIQVLIHVCYVAPCLCVVVCRDHRLWYTTVYKLHWIKIMTWLSLVFLAIKLLLLVWNYLVNWSFFVSQLPWVHWVRLVCWSVQRGRWWRSRGHWA